MPQVADLGNLPSNLDLNVRTVNNDDEDEGMFTKFLLGILGGAATQGLGTLAGEGAKQVFKEPAKDYNEIYQAMYPELSEKLGNKPLDFDAFNTMVNANINKDRTDVERERIKPPEEKGIPAQLQVENERQNRLTFQELQRKIENSFAAPQGENPAGEFYRLTQPENYIPHGEFFDQEVNEGGIGFDYDSIRDLPYNAENLAMLQQLFPQNRKALKELDKPRPFSGKLTDAQLKMLNKAEMRKKQKERAEETPSTRKGKILPTPEELANNRLRQQALKDAKIKEQQTKTAEALKNYKGPSRSGNPNSVNIYGK